MLRGVMKLWSEHTAWRRPPVHKGQCGGLVPGSAVLQSIWSKDSASVFTSNALPAPQYWHVAQDPVRLNPEVCVLEGGDRESGFA